MADEPKRSTTGTLVLILVVALVLIVIWQSGLFGGEEEATYEAGATDVGGGELIVREPDPDEVPVDVPDAPLTPVPAETPGEAPTQE